MDKNTTTGLILIGAVVMAFMFLNQPNNNKILLAQLVNQMKLFQWK